MKKFLVTGGAGFIGSHLSEALLKKGHEVVVIDDFSTAPVGINNPGIKSCKISIDDVEKVINVFEKEKPNFVFHLAGAINLRRPIIDPLFVKDLDFLERTKIILNACRKNKIKKIIFVSSGGAIYDNAKVIPTPERYLSHPVSLYGLANLMIEKYIELYCKNYNLGFTIPRLSNVYGPRQWETGIIPSIIIKILRKENPIIYGKGNQTRDFIYIDDAVEALIILAEKGENGIYNVGTGREISLNEVFKLAKDIIGIKVSPIYKDSRVSETARSALDIKKMKKEFGWHSETNIKTGLAKTIEWYGKS